VYFVSETAQVELKSGRVYAPAAVLSLRHVPVGGGQGGEHGLGLLGLIHRQLLQHGGGLAVLRSLLRSEPHICVTFQLNFSAYHGGYGESLVPAYTSRSVSLSLSISLSFSLSSLSLQRLLVYSTNLVPQRYSSAS